jgi:hypothetical protein
LSDGTTNLTYVGSDAVTVAEIFVSDIIMGTEMIPETLVIFDQLTRLTVREDFIVRNPTHDILKDHTKQI